MKQTYGPKQHQHHIIHRDIKAENVFFSDSQTVKVGDFGFSTEVKTRQDLLNTFCGSPPYAAPELFSDESYLGPLVDIWALGVLLYFMVSGGMPFKAQTVSSLKKLIIEGEYLMPDFISRDCSRVIRGLLQHEPLKRLTLDELRQSKWLERQTFPRSLPKYKVSLLCTPVNSSSSNTCNEFDKKCPHTPSPSPQTQDIMSADEEETRVQLQHLGISQDLLIQNRDKGVRSNVIGTYRILMHRILCQRIWENNASLGSSSSRHKDPYSVKNNEKREGEKKTGNGHISIPSSDHHQHASDDLPPASSRLPVESREGKGNIITTDSFRKISKKKSRKNLWKDNRIFIDSEGFFIPDALNHKNGGDKVTSIVHPASQDKSMTVTKMTNSSKDQVLFHRKEHRHKKKALLPSCILF